MILDTAPSAATLLLLISGLAVASEATPCSVPGTHTSIQAAIDDPSCDPIQLAQDDYPESLIVDRSLAIEGPAVGWATLWGSFQAQGIGTVVTVDGLEVRSGCPGPALESLDGARVESGSLRAVKSGNTTCNGVDRIFEDGFESGDTSRWTAANP